MDSGVEESRIIRIPLDDADYGELHDSRRLSGYIKERATGDDMWYVFLDEVYTYGGLSLILSRKTDELKSKHLIDLCRELL